MAKRKKPKYYVAQIGAQTSGNFNWGIPENPTPSIVNQTATGAADIYGNQYFKPDETGTPTTNNPNVVPIDHKGNRLFDQLARYGQKDLNPTFQALNAGMQTVTAIANQVNEVKNRRNEKDQYLRAITPDYYENMEGYGLNANPIFTKYGGKTMKYQVGGERWLPNSKVRGINENGSHSLKRANSKNNTTDRMAMGFTSLDDVPPVYQSPYQIPTPNYSPMNLNQPTDFSATYPVGLGQQSVYFPNKGAWQGFINSGALSGVSSSETPTTGSATGYRTMQVGGGTGSTAFPGATDENDFAYYRNARLQYYKEQLNNKLKEKNPEAFGTFMKGVQNARLTGNPKTVDDFIQNSTYNDYLTPDEVKATLGDDDFEVYDAFLNEAKPNLSGTIEGQKSYSDLNYGRRFASLPFSTSYSKANKTRGTNYSRQYQYTPDKGLTINESGDTNLRPPQFKDQNFVNTDAQDFVKMFLGTRRMQKNDPAAYKKMMSEVNAVGMKTGGSIPKTYGLQKGGESLANVEAEQGEAFQTNDGQIAQVADDAPTHDQGGVFLPNVHRVLENTSNIRKDKTSKILKLTPADVEHATGAKVKGNMSHAEALVKADEYFEKERNKITKKIELAAKDRQELDKYANLSTTLNVDHFQKLPTKEVLFEQLFNNQEMVKAMNNIPTGGEAKNGGQITKAQIGAYKGSKTGKKTPAGNSDAFPETATSTFQDYLNDLNTKGFKYEGIGSNAELQQALYEYKLQHKEFDDLRNMWKEGMHQTGMAKAKQLGFIDDKGNFKPGVLDNEDNLRKLAELYPDNMLGPRTLRVNKGKKPPRIWTDEEIPAEETPLTPIQDLDTSITPPNIVQQPRSRFNEPLRWYDVASPVNAYMAALEREPGNYNPMEFNQLRYKLLDPTAALQQNQADFNAGVQAINTGSGAGMANVANLAAQKFAANNQVLGNYENQNAQIKNNEITYNTQVRDKNSAADQQARELFENKVLTSKAIQQEQKLTALDSLYKTIAENRALNRNGNLIMKFSRAFDQYGEYNGYQPIFTINPQLGIGTDAYNTTTPKTGAAGAAGGIQQLAQGKNYYNRKTGKTLYFDGKKLVERK